MFRAQSSYNTPLSFGEFEAMMVPLGYFLVMHSTGFRDRLFGVVVVSACWIGIFCSGARGGYQSAIVATGFFAALWGVRTALFDRRSLMPALLALVWIMGAASLVGLLVVSTRIRNVVVGGGHESYSTQARWEQWAMAQPHIAANPITGHGFGLGAEVVGYHMDAATLGGTLDSYVISTLVETGIPGFVFFFGMIIAAMSRGVQRYLLDPSRSGAFAGALGCSLLAFGYYRIALSQAENHTLFYVIVGLVMAVWHDRRLDQDQTAKIW
jgi:O-antigen ligase